MMTERKFNKMYIWLWKLIKIPQMKIPFQSLFVQILYIPKQLINYPGTPYFYSRKSFHHFLYQNSKIHNPYTEGWDTNKRKAIEKDITKI